MKAYLVPVEEIAGLDAPCRRHPDEPALVSLAGSRFATLASRALPESDLGTAVLFGRWLTWFAAFDDERDSGMHGRDVEWVNSRYRELTAIVGGAPSRNPFAALWRPTAARADSSWRQRFRLELRQHWRGSLWEATNRRERRMPEPAEYERMRRITNGALLFLLPEVMLRVSMPVGLTQAVAWRALVDACNDVTGWCNDLASVSRERGDMHNYVLVMAHALGVSLPAAAERVRERIAQRMGDMALAARELPSTFDSFGLSRSTACDVSRVAVTLLAAPRGHLEWLHESSRYHGQQAVNGRPAPTSPADPLRSYRAN